MNTGQIAFQCADSNCADEQLVGKIIYNFVRMKLVAHQNAQILIEMSSMGFDEQTMTQFKEMI